MSRWVVVGAGYTGAKVAARLAARGERVIATRRSAAAAAAVAAAGEAVAGEAVAAAVAGGAGSIEPRTLDVAVPGALDGLLARGDVVVITAPPTDPDARGDAAIAAAAAGAGVARVVYVSSTGVYGPGGGAWVDETWPLDATSASGRARIAAERALAACEAIVLRPAGIYGPDRGVIARMRARAYRRIGDGRTATSRIHVEDLATAVIAAGDRAPPGAVYNVADDDPGPSADLVEAAVAALELPPPPTVALAAVDPEVAAMVAADRRIDNRRLKHELGVVLRYPSWRDAFAEELAAR